MAKHTNLGELFTDIADAIRSKTGSAGMIIADEFPNVIATISIGGGGGSGYPTPETLTFTFEDGSIVDIKISELNNLTLQEGNVVKISIDGIDVWSAEKATILKVEKITSDTYASNTTYSGEEFLALDIYPKSGGTVTVSYGGSTKTITDDGTTTSPSEQMVVFGTFNGVSDEVETPESGTLIIEGDCAGFGISSYNTAKSSTAYCSCITEVVNFGNMEHIPDFAFQNCESLTSVNIPSTVTSIGDSAFIGCHGLKSINIPFGIEDIKTFTFSMCSELTSVNIPSTVTSIGSSAFAGCGSLSEIILPSALTSIGSYAFENCSSLSKITIPSTVTSIGTNPWIGCFKNNAITVESGNVAYKIVGNCLYNIDSKSIVSGFDDANLLGFGIFDSINNIGNYAFYGRTGLTHVSQLSFCNIGDYAFYGCTGLTSIDGAISSVGSNAFYGCTGLTNIDISNWGVMYCTIKDYAFYLPSGNTRTIVTTKEDPAGYSLSGEHVFDEVGTNNIIVPVGCGDAYKAASVWSKYADYITEASA